MDLAEEFYNFEEVRVDAERMAREGMGEEPDTTTLGGPPPLPRRYNMVISTTEYHKLIAARDNIVHPKLRTYCSTRGQSIMIQTVRDEFPKADIRMAYGKSLQIFMRAWMGRKTADRHRVFELADQMMRCVFRANRKGLQARGYTVDDISTISAESKRVWSRWHLLISHYQKLRQKFSSSGFAIQIVTDGPIRVLLTPSGWGFQLTRNDPVHVAPLSALMMVMHSLELAGKTCIACDITRSDLPRLRSWYLTMLDIQRRIVIKGGDAAYDVAKGPEALCKTYASDISGGHHGYGPSSFEKMSLKYRVKAAALGVEDVTEELIQHCAQGASVDECTEMSGMAASFGYPVIDVEASGAKSRETGSEEDTSVPYAVEQVLLLFQHLVLKNYVKIRSQYPPITFSKKGTKLERLVDAKFLDLQDGTYPLEDWRYAEMHDMFEFMYHEDYLALVADKATLEPKSKAREYYMGSLSDVTIRRLVAKVLNHPFIDTRADVDAFAREAWPDEWRRCRLVPKEQEHKAKARMFVVLPDMVRRALSIIQENVKELFFPVIPYTSMAMSGYELSEFLHRSTHGVGKYKLELDLSSWNLKFRKFLTQPFGYLMDRMAGVVNLFGGSHRFFAGAEFCVSHRDTRNEALEDMYYPNTQTPDSDMLWHNDESGKEGIEQRFWTIITEVMIYRCLYRHKLPFSLLGQGDNQTLVIDMATIPEKERGAVAADIEEDIELGTAEVNHVCKPEEFLGSMSVLTYGKNFFVNGRQIPQCIKACARITHGSSDALETVEDDLGGIASSAYTASLNAPRPLDVYALGAFHFYAHCASIWRGLSPYTNTEAVEAGYLAQNPLAWLVPSVLGGLPTVPAAAYIYRGDPDPLSHAIASLRLASGLDHVRQFMAYLDSPSAYVDRPSRNQLVLNPYGLPLMTVKSGASVMQEFTLSYLCGVQNRDVCELANVAAGGKDQLLDAIGAITPFIPSMVEDMISASVIGRAEKVAKKFSAAGTLLKLAPMETVAQACGAAFRRVRSVNLHFMGAATCIGYEWHEYSYDVAERLRLRWGLGKGAIVGASVAQPLDYTICADIGPGVTTVLRGEYDLSVTGPCPPYLGSKTLERRTVEKYQIEMTPGTIDLAKMILSMTAGGVSQQVEAIYRSIIGSRTTMPLEELMELFPHTSSGTPGHRYESMQGARAIGPVGNPGPRTWMSTDTDNIPGISGSVHDYPIPIQSFMSCTVSAAVMSSRRHEAQRVFRISLGSSQYPELPDPSRHCLVAPPSLRPLPMNALCQVPDVRILRTAAKLGISADQKISRTALCSGLLTLVGGCGSNARAAADLGDIRIISQIDIAGALSTGANCLLEGAIRACTLLFMWHMTWFTEEVQWRHDHRVLCDNLAASIAKPLYPVLTHPEMHGECLTELGIGRENPGPSGYRAGVDQLRRMIAGEVRLRVRSADLCMSAWAGTQFPHTAHGAPLFFLPRLQMGVTTWCAFLRMDAHALGVLKTAIRTTWRRVARAGTDNPGLASAVGMRDFYKFVHVLLGHEKDVTGLFAGFPKVVPYDTAQAWRRLRRYKRRTARHEPTSIEQFKQPIPEVNGCDVIETGISSIRAPILGEQRVHGISLWDRTQRICGLRSTLPGLFAPILHGEQGPVLVVGTGSGGIQRCCAALGLHSYGLDLCSMIPPERTARTGWKPTDIWGLQTAVLSASMWNYNGDWYGTAGTLALAEQPFRTVVIDVQSGERRVGPEVLEPLGMGRYEGIVLWRTAMTSLEVDAVYSWLRAKGSNPTVIPGCRNYPTRDKARPVIIRFRNRLGPAPERATYYNVRPALPVYAKPQDAKACVEACVNDLTGGLYRITDMVKLTEVIDQGCADDSIHRDKTQLAQGLMHLRLKLLLERLMNHWADVQEANDVWLKDAPPHGSLGPLTVTPDDHHVFFLWRRVMPRLVGALRYYWNEKQGN
jgi:hypothetical protein